MRVLISWGFFGGDDQDGVVSGVVAQGGVDGFNGREWIAPVARYD